MAAGGPNNSTRRLSRMLLAQRARTAGLVLLVLVPIFGLLLYWAHERSAPVVAERRLSGTVVRTIFDQREMGARSRYVVVQLVDGEEVTARMSSQQALLPGEQVMLTERRFEGSKVRYSFP